MIRIFVGLAVLFCTYLTNRAFAENDSVKTLRSTPCETARKVWGGFFPLSSKTLFLPIGQWGYAELDTIEERIRACDTEPYVARSDMEQALLTVRLARQNPLVLEVEQKRAAEKAQHEVSPTETSQDGAASAETSACFEAKDSVKTDIRAAGAAHAASKKQKDEVILWIHVNTTAEWVPLEKAFPRMLSLLEEKEALLKSLKDAEYYENQGCLAPAVEPSFKNFKKEQSILLNTVTWFADQLEANNGFFPTNIFEKGPQQ